MKNEIDDILKMAEEAFDNEVPEEEYDGITESFVSYKTLFLENLRELLSNYKKVSK